MRGQKKYYDDSHRKFMEERECPLCKCTLRDPVSGPCKHPACKSCIAVLFTRDLPHLDSVRCPSCNGPLDLHELKSDIVAQRKLQRIKSYKCNNCSWKGSYTEYIQNHERNCGGGAHIQCKVLGCGKWLPEKRALDVHRIDDWCPMILITKARLNHEKIVKFSMRETWDWTCGLVLKSDKKSVRDLIKRLEIVFGVLDPTVPLALENDEYAANQTSESDCLSELMCTGKDVRARQKGSNGRSNPEDEADRQSFDKRSSSATISTGASAAGGATNGRIYEDDEPESYEKEFRGAGREKETLKALHYEIQKGEKELQMVKRDISGLLKNVNDLMNMPKAFAAIHDKQELFQGVLATFNKDVMAVYSRLDKLKLSPNFTDPGVHDKLQKKCQELERSVTSLRQYGQKIDDRLVSLETSYSGVFLWKIANYIEKKRDAMNTKVKSIYSPPFFTSQYGYKLCGRVFLMGDGVGKGTHISLFLTIMKGPFDAVLPWPFKERVIFQLVNQGDPINKSIVEAFRPDPAIERPTTERITVSGYPLFAKIKMIEDPKSGFVRDDTIYLKIVSQT